MKIQHKLRFSLVILYYVFLVQFTYSQDSISLEELKTEYQYLKSNLKTSQNKVADNERIVELSLIIYGEKSSEYAGELKGLILLYCSLEEYEKTLPLYDKRLSIYKSIFGEGNKLYRNELDHLTTTLKAMGNYEKAIEVGYELLEMVENSSGKKHKDYARVLNNLAMFHSLTSEYDKAVSLYLEAIPIFESNVGKKHKYYRSSIENLISLYLKMGNYKNAEKMTEELSEVMESFYNKNSEEYARQLRMLGHTNRLLGRINVAGSYFEKVLKIIGKIKGKNSEEYSADLARLTSVNELLGNYSMVLEQRKNALAILENFYGEDHPDYGARLNDVALSYNKLGEFDKALSLYQEALLFIKKNNGEFSREYAAVVSNLAVLYGELGQVDKAIDMCRKALRLQERLVGKAHPDYALALHNLGFTFSSRKGDYEKGIPFFEEALNILNQDHPTYGTIIGSLALSYYETGDIDKALEMQRNLIKRLGKRHRNFGQMLNNLAYMLMAEGRNKEALVLIERSLGKTDMILDHVLECYSNLILVYEGLGMFSKAAKILERLMISEINRINNQAAFVSEAVQATLLSSPYSRAPFYQSFLHKYNEREGLLEHLLNYQFLLNSFMLESKKELINGIKSAEPETKELYERWLKLKKVLAYQMSLSIDKQRMNLDSLGEITEQLEIQLVAKSKDFAAIRQKIGLKNVQEKLNSEEGLLLFSHFDYFSKRELTDSTLYVAYLVHPSDKQPEMLYLFEQKQLDSLLSTSNYRNISDFYNSRGVKPIRKGSAKKKQLYDLIWKPLLPYLEGIKKLYINPSGQLCKINLGAIPIDSTSRLSDKFKINYISSTKNFVLSKEKEYRNTALILGGLDYNNFELSQDSTTEYFYHDFNEIGLERDLRGDSWNFLAGTKKEAEEISRFFKKKNYMTTHLEGEKGTERIIKKYDGEIPSPRVLHIATHGFFFPNPKEECDNQAFGMLREEDRTAYRFSEDPLIRTGLILSGANKAWQGQPPLAGQEDNILTAYEIADLDLTNTELVVLSACETGLGDINQTDGVYGLQRGFKLAGVKYLIISLWKVPDRETQEMMVLFYKKWLEEGMEIPAAFKAAQDEMREQYEDEPEKWAGFILMD